MISEVGARQPRFYFRSATSQANGWKSGKRRKGDETKLLRWERKR